jgi:hypothetical protein
MDSNICLGCRFGSVKIEIVVPEEYDIKDFAEETRNFNSEINAITKKKPMHYSLMFGSESNHSTLEFKVHCSCILNINKKECSRFNADADRDCKVKHLVYSKTSTAEQIEIKMRQ